VGLIKRAEVDQGDRIAMFKSDVDGLASVSVDLASTCELDQTLVGLLALNNVVMDSLFHFWFLHLDRPKFDLDFFFLRLFNRVRVIIVTLRLGRGGWLLSASFVFSETLSLKQHRRWLAFFRVGRVLCLSHLDCPLLLEGFGRLTLIAFLHL